MRPRRVTTTGDGGRRMPHGYKDCGPTHRIGEPFDRKASAERSGVFLAFA
jgi:hypothetical protein